MKNPFLLLLAIGLASCAAPKKALIIAEEPKESTKQEIAVVAPTAPTLPTPKGDGLRMPDMLALPDENQLRSAPSEKTGEAAVIVRPPAE